MPVPKTVADALEYLQLELKQCISSAARAQAVVKVLQERQGASPRQAISGDGGEDVPAAP